MPSEVQRPSSRVRPCACLYVSPSVAPAGQTLHLQLCTELIGALVLEEDGLSRRDAAAAGQAVLQGDLDCTAVSHYLSLLEAARLSALLQLHVAGLESSQNLCDCRCCL
jgi:hypothetical protein